MEPPLQLCDPASLRAFRISPQDTVRLAVIHHPDATYDSSVVFEVWDPGGAQPPNKHERSVETFLFLKGSGTAYCDGYQTRVRAGQLLVLAPGSLHRIVADSSSRLYAITTMAPDEGFAQLIESGHPAPLEAEDLAVLGSV